MDPLIPQLLQSDEPCIRYAAARYFATAPLSAPEEDRLRQDIRRGKLAQTLLSEIDSNGEIPGHPYKKWTGAHWVLVSLAGIDYPPGSPELAPLSGQVFRWVLSREFLDGVRPVQGRVRGHPCIVGNFLFSLCRLGLADERTGEVADLLLRMQWDDGGWNCDHKPHARHSSFNPTAIAVRGLAAWKQVTGTGAADSALERGIRHLLDHELCKRISTGVVVHADFLKFFYPEYYHYSVLYGLKVLMEAGVAYDTQLDFTLDHIRAARTGFGWPVNKKYYWKSAADRAGRSLVNWGPNRETEMNEFVTIDALRVLHYFGDGGAGRLH